MRIEILGTPFNGLGTPTEIENPADGLRQAKRVPALVSKGHSVTDLGDLESFRFQEIRDPETGIRDFKLWMDVLAENEHPFGTPPAEMWNLSSVMMQRAVDR